MCGHTVADRSVGVLPGIAHGSDVVGDRLTSAEPALTVEEASRMAATAVTCDLEYWARSAFVDGRVDLNDLLRVLEVIRQASVPEC
jgi:hypothetical protein